MDRQSVGKKGENIACEYLIKNGYIIQSRNQQFNQSKQKIGEIDIIATKDNTTYIFEVKTRTTVRFGNAQETITPKKLQTLYSITEHLSGYYKNTRLQLISIQFINTRFQLIITDLY